MHLQFAVGLDPENGEAVQLLTSIEQQIVKRVTVEAQKHVAFGQVDAAVEVISNGLQEVPGNPTLMRLKEAVVRAKGAQEQDRQKSTAGRPSCAYCGNSLTASMKFCDRCGHAVRR